MAQTADVWRQVLSKAHLEVEVYYLNRAIASNHWKHGIQLLNTAKAARFQADVVSYNSLVATLPCSGWRKAIFYLHSMVDVFLQQVWHLGDHF
eukprot:symbB.v1.2.040961.t1/scaffold7691.1/size9874/2